MSTNTNTTDAVSFLPPLPLLRPVGCGAPDATFLSPSNAISCIRNSRLCVATPPDCRIDYTAVARLASSLVNSPAFVRFCSARERELSSATETASSTTADSVIDIDIKNDFEMYDPLPPLVFDDTHPHALDLVNFISLRAMLRFGAFVKLPETTQTYAYTHTDLVQYYLMARRLASPMPMPGGRIALDVAWMETEQLRSRAEIAADLGIDMSPHLMREHATRVEGLTEVKEDAAFASHIDNVLACVRSTAHFLRTRGFASLGALVVSHLKPKLKHEHEDSDEARAKRVGALVCDLVRGCPAFRDTRELKSKCKSESKPEDEDDNDNDNDNACDVAVMCSKVLVLLRELTAVPQLAPAFGGYRRYIDSLCAAEPRLVARLLTLGILGGSPRASDARSDTTLSVTSLAHLTQLQALAGYALDEVVAQIKSASLSISPLSLESFLLSPAFGPKNEKALYLANPNSNSASELIGSVMF